MADQPIHKTPNSNTRVMMFGTILVAVVGAAIILFALFNRPADKTTPLSSDNEAGAAIIEGDPFTGVEPVDPPRQLQAWTLTSKDNKPFSLSDLKGKMALILFGYTHCPDVCPLTMLDYKKIKEQLGDKANQVNFVFISIDGERDTPEVIKKFLDKFDTSFIGLTGDEATLKRMGGDYELYFAKVADPSGSTENYLMDHNSSTYLVDQDGKLVALYVYGTEPEIIAEDINARLST